MSHKHKRVRGNEEDVEEEEEVGDTASMSLPQSTADGLMRGVTTCTSSTAMFSSPVEFDVALFVRLFMR